MNNYEISIRKPYNMNDIQENTEILKQRFRNKSLLKKEIKKFQKEKNNIVYPLEKSEHDVMKCVLCDGSFTRQNFHLHSKTRKHSKAFEKLYSEIYII